MAACSHQQHTHELPPFAASTANNLEPSVFEFANDPAQDLDVAPAHWAELTAYDLDELYANLLPSLQPALPPSHIVQQTEVNYVQSPGYQHPPTLTSCTYTLSSLSAAVGHLQCLPDHEFAGAHGGLPAFVIGPNTDPTADPTVIASDAVRAHQQHSFASADKFKSAHPILGGGCLSEPNHMEDQLLLRPLIMKRNGASPYITDSLALEDVNHLMSPSLPVSPTSGASNPRNMSYYTSATFDSSAMAGSSFPTYYHRMNGALPLSPTQSVNKIDTKLREEMSFTDNGSQVTIRVKTEKLNLDDGYKWRKYGQKDIKKKAFKKSYLRCARHIDKGCKVLKRIQRCSDDQDYIDFTYTGRHNHPA